MKSMTKHTVLMGGQGVCWQVWGAWGIFYSFLTRQEHCRLLRHFYFILLHNFCLSICLFCLLIRWFWQWLRTLSMANDQAEGRGVVSCCQEHTSCEQKSTINKSLSVFFFLRKKAKLHVSQTSMLTLFHCPWSQPCWCQARGVTLDSNRCL